MSEGRNVILFIFCKFRANRCTENHTSFRAVNEYPQFPRLLPDLGEILYARNTVRLLRVSLKQAQRGRLYVSCGRKFNYFYSWGYKEQPAAVGVLRH